MREREWLQLQYVQPCPGGSKAPTLGKKRKKKTFCLVYFVVRHFVHFTAEPVPGSVRLCCLMSSDVG